MSVTYQINEDINGNLKWLQTHNELCDVLLVSGNKKVPAHSCVLSSHSPVLAAILQARLAVQNDWSILKPLIILMDEEESHLDTNTNDEEGSHSVLELLVSFIYGETITVEVSKIQELANLSKLLGLSQHFTSNAPPEEISPDRNFAVKRKSKRKISKDVDCIVSRKPEESSDLERASSPLKCTSTPKEKEFVPSVPINTTERRKKWVRKYETKNISSLEFLKRNTKLKTGFDEKPATTEEEIISPPPEKNSLLLSVSDNLSDAEAWFKNELLNCGNLKPVDNTKCVDLNNQMEETKMKDYSRNQFKRTRIAISCSKCKSTFHRASDLIKHVKEESHYSEVCPLCFIQISDCNDQKMHFIQHDHELPFFCCWCELRFRTRADLSMHIPKHSSTKPYTCNECGRSFKWRHSAQAHSVTHKSQCHLLCDICGFSSKYASTFQSHLKRHYGQFFPCPHPGCEYKSFRKTHLNDHLSTHEKLRRHQCEICGHSFSQAKNLRRHLRLHTSTFLKCSLEGDGEGGECPFKTTRPDKLRFHLLQKHNVSESSVTSKKAMIEGGRFPPSPSKEDVDDPSLEGESFAPSKESGNPSDDPSQGTCELATPGTTSQVVEYITEGGGEDCSSEFVLMEGDESGTSEGGLGLLLHHAPPLYDAAPSTTPQDHQIDEIISALPIILHSEEEGDEGRDGAGESYSQNFSETRECASEGEPQLNGTYYPLSCYLT